MDDEIIRKEFDAPDAKEVVARSRGKAKWVWITGISVFISGLFAGITALSVLCSRRPGAARFVVHELSGGPGGLFGVLYNLKDEYYSLAKIDPSSGKTLWRTVIGKKPNVSQLVVSRKRVWLTFSDGRIACYGARTGEALWEANPGAEVYIKRNMIPVGDGLLFLGNDDTLRRFDREGNEVWSSPQRSWQGFGLSGSRVFLPQDKDILALSLRTGRKLSTASPGFYTKWLAVDGRGVYAVGYPGPFWEGAEVLKMDPGLSGVRWRALVKACQQPDSLVLLGKVLYLFGDSLFALSPATGEITGVFSEPDWDMDTVCSDGRTLFLITERTKGIAKFHLHALEPKTLRVRWTRTLNHPWVVVDSGGGGIVLMDTLNSKLRLVKLDSRLGNEVWAQELKATGSLYQAFSLDRRIVILDFLRVFCLDSKTGKILWDEIQ